LKRRKEQKTEQMQSSTSPHCRAHSLPTPLSSLPTTKEMFSKCLEEKKDRKRKRKIVEERKKENYLEGSKEKWSRLLQSEQ
jgi:hypothetical protein